jgi:hypothetical protein
MGFRKMKHAFAGLVALLYSCSSSTSEEELVHRLVHQLKAKDVEKVVVLDSLYALSDFESLHLRLAARKIDEKLHGKLEQLGCSSQKTKQLERSYFLDEELVNCIRRLDLNNGRAEVMKFSRVCFSHDQAIVYFESISNRSDSYGGFVVLESVEGEWRIEKEYPIWFE